MFTSTRDLLEKELILSLIEGNTNQYLDDITENDFAYESNKKAFGFYKAVVEANGSCTLGYFMNHVEKENIASKYWIDTVGLDIKNIQTEFTPLILDELRGQSKKDELESILNSVARQAILTDEQKADIEKFISDSRRPENSKTNKDHVNAFLNFLSGDNAGISTGFSGLDKLITGYIPKTLVFLAARPGQGKSAFAHQSALELILEKNVLLVTCEMTANDVITRLVSHKSGISSTLIKHKTLREFEIERVTDAVCSIFGEGRLRLVEAIGKKPKEIVSIVAYEGKQQAYDLVIIDQLQSLVYGNSMVREIGNFNKTMRSLADKLNFTCLILCQLNRQVDRKDAGIPTLSDLRDSGDIEQDADCVVFIHQPKKCANSTERVLTVAKNRFGPKGIVKVYFDGATTTFTEEEVFDEGDDPL